MRIIIDVPLREVLVTANVSAFASITAFPRLGVTIEPVSTSHTQYILSRKKDLPPSRRSAARSSHRIEMRGLERTMGDNPESSSANECGGSEQQLYQRYSEIKIRLEDQNGVGRMFKSESPLRAKSVRMCNPIRFTSSERRREDAWGWKKEPGNHFKNTQPELTAVTAEDDIVTQPWGNSTDTGP